MRKAQAEFIVVLGLLIVAVVVIYYAYQSFVISPAPANIAEEQRAVRASLEDFIGEAVQSTMRNLYSYGGYLGPSDYANSVTYNGKDIPYWQYNGQASYPDSALLKSNLVKGITDYINENKDSLAGSFGKNVTIGNLVSVNPTIYDNYISLEVNLPTGVLGYPVEQPYRLSVQTKLGEIHDFSKNLVSNSLSNRYFEYFTLSSMMISPMDNGFPVTPPFVFLTRCGEYYYKDWFDLKPHVEERIETTLGHTYMPGKVPLNTMHSTSFPKYTLPRFNGKPYSDLDVSFLLPDDFELTENTLQINPNPIFAYSEPIPYTGICQSDHVYVKYYIDYPAVVVVRDTLTGYLFQFAYHVYIKDNAPGTFTLGVSGYVPEVQQEICDSKGCSVSLLVVDSDSRGVDGASVNFMGCSLGRTDSDGAFSGSAPCGMSVLDIYKKGYDTYSKKESSKSLSDKLVFLLKKPYVTLYLHEVIVQNLTNEYWIKPDGVDYLNVFDEDELAYLNFYTTERYTEPYTFWFDTMAGSISQLTAGNYSIGGGLFSNLVGKGGFVAYYEISEELDGKELHIYYPSMPGFDGIEGTEAKTSAMQILANVLRECGLGPVSESSESLDSMCIVTHSEVSP